MHNQTLYGQQNIPEGAAHKKKHKNDKRITFIPCQLIFPFSLHGMGREVNYSTEAGASRLIHMAIGDVLYTRIAMADPALFESNMTRMRHEISKKRLP